jgi:hypothetical protein
MLNRTCSVGSQILVSICLTITSLNLAYSKPSQVMLETPYLALRLSPENGSYEIEDKAGKVEWGSDPYAPRFGKAALLVDGKTQDMNLSRVDVKRNGDGVELSFSPLVANPNAKLRVTIQAREDGKALEFSYALSDDLPLESIDLLEDTLWTTGTDKGYVIVPARLGCSPQRFF